MAERRTFGRGDRGSKPPVAERRTFGRGTGVQNHLWQSVGLSVEEPGFKTTCGKASDFRSRGPGFNNHLLPFQNLGNFVHPTLPVSFERDNKSHWSLLPGVYVRGSKISHTGGKCITCRGLKGWWSLSLTHQFPARERRRAGLTTLLRSPVLDMKKKKKNKFRTIIRFAKYPLRAQWPIRPK